MCAASASAPTQSRAAASFGSTADVADQQNVERQQRATAAREEVTALNIRITALTDSLHRDEVAKAQAALRIEQLEQFGMAADDLIAGAAALRPAHPGTPGQGAERELAELGG